MKYSRVYIDAIGYELAPVVMTTAELESRLRPLYEELHIPEGQLEAWTGINERRWWNAGHSLSEGAAAAAHKAIAMAGVRPVDIDALLYAGVCREQFEPATACRVASLIGISPGAAIYDISNACLGVLNGMIDIANRIELGQIRAGVVVSCESARDIVEITIGRMLQQKNMEQFKSSLATLTGGSGAVAVLLTDGSFSNSTRRRLAGGVTQSAPEHHGLCRWGMEAMLSPLLAASRFQEPGALVDKVESMLLTTLRQSLGAVLPTGLAQRAEGLVRAALHQNIQGVLPSAVSQRIGAVLPSTFTPVMTTDSISVLKHGVNLGLRTWTAFQSSLGWVQDQVDKVICHQVGSSHRDAILKSLHIAEGKDFCTYEYLGNMGTVSLPLTAALAEEREFLRPGDRVGFLGIGSGLNCLMLGIEW